MEHGLFIWLSVTLLFGLFALLKPFGTRIFLGFFFMGMALGVNLVIALSNAQLVAVLGAESPISFYRWAFEHWVAAAPLAFILPIIIGQLAAGILMLGKGTRARLGLYGAILFLVLSAPLHPMALPNLIFAAGTWLLLRRGCDRSFRDLFRHSPSHGESAAGGGPVPSR